MWKFMFGSKPKANTKEFEFRSKYTFEQRSQEANKIMKKHPDKVPVVIEKGIQNNLPELDLKKFLVKKDLTLGQLMYKLRIQLDKVENGLNSSEAIFLFVNNESIPATTQTIGQLHEKYAAPDSFLYFSYMKEDTFG